MSLVGFQARNHPQQKAKASVDDRGTTFEVFASLHERFGFTVDACATAANAKLPRFYSPELPLRCMWAQPGECGPHGCLGCEHGGAGHDGSIGVDGLAQDWTGERVWCNPPYSNISAWVRKADDETYRGLCELAVLLLPANRCEQGWWQTYVEPFRDRPQGRCHVEFLPGRMRFIVPPADTVLPNERPPFGCCLVIWGEE